jgi:adenine-specific DNA methylase
MTPVREPLLTRVPWDEVNVRVSREQRSRERTTPTVSVFRWWARRPHALIGALLDAACAEADGLRVADLFSGGGTVAVEAARRGLDVYAQDLHPWATTGLHAVLDVADVEELDRATTLLKERLEPVRMEFYGSECPTHGVSETVHAFWVRVVVCPDCAGDVFLYPYALVSLASRSRDEKYGFYGCTACGAVSRSRLESASHRCRACGRRHREGPLTPARIATCRHCRHSFHAWEAAGGRFEQTLVQRLCGETLHLDYPAVAERAPVTPPADIPAALRAQLPDGIETGVLRRAGFSSWADLYPPRQLATLLAAAHEVDGLRTSAAIKRRLRLAVCGAAEMAGFASRWDRYYPKALEAVANHRFALTGFACETNLLGSRGRGTLPRRLKASLNAVRWAAKNGVVHPARHYVARGAPVDTRGSVVVRGSSERQRVGDGSFDLILTDPPYYDDVQYAELASLFLAWGQATGLVPKALKLDLRHEAVPNRSRGTSADDYERLLCRILQEARRTLRARGRLVLTFHNSDLRAWAALATALARAGFHVSALAVAHSENERDHAKRSVRAFSKDLVIECRSEVSERIAIAGSPDVDDEARELIAAGKAMAASGDGGFDCFRELFLAQVSEIAERRIGRDSRRADGGLE